MRDKIIIYGGSSLISKYLFLEFYKDEYEFIVFCRDKKKVTLHIESLKLDPSRFTIHNLSLEDIDENVNTLLNESDPLMDDYCNEDNFKLGYFLNLDIYSHKIIIGPGKKIHH